MVHRCNERCFCFCYYLLLMMMMRIIIRVVVLWMIRMDGPPPIAVLIVASSWPILIMSTRPFTNTIEACCVAVLLRLVNHFGYYVIDGNSNNHRHSNRQVLIWSSVGSGAICAFGTFTRFTFVFFGFPSVFEVFLELMMHFGWSRIQCWTLHVGCMATSLIVISMMFVWTDRRFYLSVRTEITTNPTSHYDETPLSSPYWVVTPFNALLYNSQTTYLKEHGLHHFV